MSSIEVAHLAYAHPGGAPLFDDVSFRVGEGQHAALIGTNGVGKSTLLRIIAGELTAAEGTVQVDGLVAVMPQLLGGNPGRTARDLLLTAAPAATRDAAGRLDRAEGALAAGDDVDGLAYARALAAWEDAGGYDLEVVWDECATRAVGLGWDAVRDRPVDTFSGGEQKRMLLEYLFASDREVLLLDEPDNFLDVPGKEWLTERLNASSRTILYISHDRELLAATSHRCITLEANGAWVHGGSFAGWFEARQARRERIDDEHRRWAEERARLLRNMREMKRRAAMSDANAKRAKAAESRLARYDAAGPPTDGTVRDQRIDMRLRGGGTGKRVLEADALELTDLTFPFDLEVFADERVAVLGRNGTGKSHFLRLLAGEPVAHEGSFKLGARVVPGWFSQTHDHDELVGRTLLEVLIDLGLGGEGSRTRAMGALRRYELSGAADQTWETLSGGQQARFQILLLEISGATLLLLDEPTDNLDVESAEALEAGLAGFDGTVICVTHDRWFLRTFDRLVMFGRDGEVGEIDDPTAAWAEPAA